MGVSVWIEYETFRGSELVVRIAIVCLIGLAMIYLGVRGMTKLARDVFNDEE